MTNSDITKQKAYKREWFYETRLNVLRESQRVLDSLSKVATELKQKTQKTQNYNAEHDIEDYKYALDFLEEAKTEGERLNPLTKEVVADLEKTHVFLVGPATLESLANQTPTNYDYVRHSKLPFDNMFFEFLEPLKMRLPFEENEHKLMAIQLKRHHESQKLDTYNAKLFYTDDKKNDLEFFTSFDYGSNGTFFCFQSSLNSYLHNIKLLKKELESLANSKIIPTAPRKKVATYALSINTREQTAKKIEIWESPDRDKKEEVCYAIPPAEIEKEGFYVQIPNLCVNLVNYINAHNVTVIRRERESTYLDKRPNGKIKKRTENRPYHLVVLKDGVRYEGEETDRTWTLNERIFVRGHDRKYRYEDQTIKMVSWIPPHIRGPLDAPFREQRYQVLYDKLQREVQMFRALGLRHDSEMWMERNN